MRATALALEFPVGRENSREFAFFRAGLAIFDINLINNSSILHMNSLRIGAGNLSLWGREFLSLGQGIEPPQQGITGTSFSHKNNSPDQRANIKTII
jgi:hypothetical protein